ncbi:three component ABC system middle component [Aeromonas veronii]|uniref:three component ABC system middle component n=1 Tax=Aeromonas veronii TaxID=654 RepID=UPI00313B50C9
MSSIVDVLYELKYNPFQYGPYLASFYSSLGESENNIILSSLVIPLCSHPTFGLKLFNSNKNSTLWTIFGERASLYDLQERVDAFKTLTEECIHYCLINEWIYINEQALSVRALNNVHASFGMQKSAEKLGKLLYGHSVVEIYSFFGVKP